MIYRPPAPSAYKPQYVTERDEPVHDDCGIVAGYMFYDARTRGEIDLMPDWSRADKEETKTRRELIRNTLGPARQKGALNLNDVNEAFTTFYPGIPPIPRWDSTGKTGLDFSMEALWKAMLQTDAVAILQGNPSKVKNADSPLRRWTVRDDFGHFVYLDRARTGQAFVMDPMGFGGDYAGEWVPLADLEQYATAFGTPIDRAMGVAKRGDATAEALTANSLNRTIHQKDVALSIAHETNAEYAKDIAQLNARIVDLEAQAQDCTAQVAEALAALRARVQAALA